MLAPTSSFFYLKKKRTNHFEETRFGKKSLWKILNLCKVPKSSDFKKNPVKSVDERTEII